MNDEESGKIFGRSPKLLTAIFFVIVVAFLVYFLKGIDFNKIRHLKVEWWPVVLASIVGLSSRYWGALLWLAILRGLGAGDIKDKPYLVYVYAKSWLARYIPGPATWMVSKIYFASKQGISKNKLAVSSLLEGALEIVVTLSVSFAMLIFDPKFAAVDRRVKLIMISALAVCVVSMIPAVFNRLVAMAYKILKHKKIDPKHQASGKVIITGSLFYLVGALFNGLSLFFMAKAIYPQLSYSNFFFVMGASNLAGAAGMLAIAVPSGLGVREGIQIVLLSVIMPKELALSIALFTRFWSVIIDGVFFGMNSLMIKLRPKFIYKL